MEVKRGKYVMNISSFMGAPQVLDAHGDREVSADAPPVERIERKFFVLPGKVDFAYGLLRQVCRRDGQYPQEQINSLYFDTPDLDQYVRSLSGEFRKDKVRIRWYGEPGDLGEEVPVFLELKSRRGFASSKRRRKLVVPVQNLELASPGRSIVPGTTIASTAFEFGYHPGKPLRPVIVISYWRYRFTEMLTGVRVSLDCSIRSTMVARELGCGEKDLRLPGAVIEVKGPTMELPVMLRRMKLLDTDWSRFSKYSSCIDAHLAELGTVGRLCPSGRVIET